MSWRKRAGRISWPCHADRIGHAESEGVMRTVLDVAVILFVVTALGVSIATANPMMAIVAVMFTIFLL